MAKKIKAQEEDLFQAATQQSDTEALDKIWEVLNSVNWWLEDTVIDIAMIVEQTGRKFDDADA